MLKALFHAVHIRDYREKELTLKDLPRNQKELNIL